MCCVKLLRGGLVSLFKFPSLDHLTSVFSCTFLELFGAVDFNAYYHSLIKTIVKCFNIRML